MKTLLFLSSFLLFTAHTRAQNKVFSGWHLGVSYYGNNLWNPGLQVTGQKVIWEKTNIQAKRDETLRIKHQQFFIDANLGFFYDNPSYSALFNNYLIQKRRVSEKGKYISYGVGIGAMRTFLPETLVYASNGSISKAKSPGNWYFTPEYTIGTGRLWKRNGTNPWRLQIHGMLQTNYNLGFNLLLNIEYGYIFGYSSKEKEYDEY